MSKIFFHNDLDGRCAGAIAYRALKDRVKESTIELIELDYKDRIEVEKIGLGEPVVIVDFSFKPEVMKRVLQKTTAITWIDHHKTAFEYNYYRELKGLRDKAFSGCELAWKYFVPDTQIPRAVELIGDRDKWCCSANTRFVVNGRVERFKDVVDKKQTDCVESIDLKTLKIEKKPIQQHFINGSTKDWIFLRWDTRRKDKGGSGYFTPEHELLVNGKMKKVKNIRIGDKIDRIDWVVTYMGKQVLLGTLLGDSSIRRNIKSKHPFIIFTQGKQQLEYLKWKTLPFSNIGLHKYYQKSNNVWQYSTRQCIVFDWFFENKPCSNNFSVKWFEEMDALAWAIWYMDDGYLYKNGAIDITCNRLGKENANVAIKILEEKTSIKGTIQKGKDSKNFKGIKIYFDKVNGEKFLNWIKKYLFIKIPDNIKIIVSPLLNGLERYLYKKSTPIVQRESKIDSNCRTKRFAIGIKDNHNFALLGGVISGNSWLFGKHTANFNMGLKLYSHHPRSAIWDELFPFSFIPFLTGYAGNDPYQKIQKIEKEGELCVKFRNSFCEDYCNSYGFETVFEGYKCFALGIYMFGSEAFGDRMKTHDICLSFEYLGDKWIVGLYSENKDIDVGKIAQKYGGGGHAGASGLECKELPFKKKENK